MKILSITAQKPHSTGSGTYLSELVRSFDSMGHRQSVVCGIYRGDIVSFPRGVNCYPVFFSDKEGLSYPITGMSDIMPYESTRYRDLTPGMISEFEEAFIAAAGRAVSELDPDLIICHHLFLLTALLRMHFPGRTICGISHGTDLRQMHNCSNLRGFVRPQIRKLDMVFALHERQAEDIKELFGMDGGRVRVIGSGYNDRLFNTEGRAVRKDAEPLRLCYAGKISRPKGVPEMLAALERLSDDPGVPPFTLTMAGGCQDSELEGRLDRLPPYINYLGQIPQPDLAALLKQTDIFILPSYFEGLPLVLIEAMASGAVPVSTDLPGIKDWIARNVSDPNVIFVPAPEMKSIDEPSEAGRAGFTEDLYDALKSAACYIGSGECRPLPDTSSVTWEGVADRILKNFL